MKKMIIPLTIFLCIVFLFSFSFSASAENAGALIMMGMGDSIGEGVQSADANLRTQPATYLNLLARQMGVHFSLPLIKSGPFGTVGDTSTRSRLMPSLAAYNIAVSGADVNSMLNDRADAATIQDINSETDLVLFPRQGSQIEIAESIRPPAIVCWIGNNDVLSAAITFDRLDASQMTDPGDFYVHFYEIVQRLSALNSAIVFANIPDVTKIAFLVDRDDLIYFLGSDYGLQQGHLTSVVVMLLIHLGLDDGSLINNPDFVLDPEEIEIMQDRIEVFNQIIEDVAGMYNHPVVDVHGMFNAIDENPPVMFGVPITNRFLGGLFSLDGVHPSNIGHALITNTFIEKINAHFNTSIPYINEVGLNIIFLLDPFTDKDGDGRVRGRFFAGALETFSYFLGISGDADDYIPQPFSLANNSGSGARESQEQALKNAVSLFKQIFGLRLINKKYF